MQSNLKRPGRTPSMGFFLFLLSLFYGGCALQSSLVDLEQEIHQTRATQQELLQLIQKFETMIKAMEKPPANNAEGMIVLLGKVNLLEEQLRRLEGRLEEGGYKTAETMRKMDDQTDQVNMLLARLTLLEKQIVTATTTPQGVTPTESTREPETTGAAKKGTSETASVPPKTQESPPSLSPSSLLPTPGGSGLRVSPQEAYRLAYNDYLSGKYDLAIINFKNYIARYPDSAFLPEAIYWIGQSYYSQGLYHEAVTFFKQMAERYPMHELVPNAWLKVALAYVALNETHSAKTFFTKVIERFPQSDAALRAKGELSALNNQP